MTDQERIARLEAQISELNEWRAALEDRQRVQDQIRAALGQPANPADWTRRSVDPRELGVTGVGAAED